MPVCAQHVTVGRLLLPRCVCSCGESGGGAGFFITAGDIGWIPVIRTKVIALCPSIWEVSAQKSVLP